MASGASRHGSAGTRLGFGVPYFNTFFLKRTIMKYKFILFSPWLLKSPVEETRWTAGEFQTVVGARL